MISDPDPTPMPCTADGDFKMPPAPPGGLPPVGEQTAATPAPVAEDTPLAGAGFKTPFFVSRSIVKHQRDATWWQNHDDLERLRTWCHLLITALDLRVKDAEYLGVPLIRIERMNVRTLGTYCTELDGYAIGGTIVLNEERLRDLLPLMEVALLLVLLVRARQHQRGGRGILDEEGRKWLKSKGLVVTERGRITIADGLPFRQLLEQEGIDVPAAAAFPKPERRGKTTNRLWSCLCQKARVGTGAFFAQCPKCNEPFRLGDYVGKRFVT